MTLFNLIICAYYRHRNALKNTICLYVLNSQEQDFGAISGQRVKVLINLSLLYIFQTWNDYIFFFCYEFLNKILGGDS